METISRKPDRELPHWVLVLIISAVMATVFAGPVIAAHWRTDVVDDQMFGYYGWRIAHGATVYLDVWDNKPPGIYWINALGMIIGNDSYGGIIALCVVALVVSLACFYVISCGVYYRGAAGLATVLAGFFMTHGNFQCGTNRTETFLIACELAAVAFYMRGFARDRWWKWLCAGMFCGAAFLFKQVGLTAWGAMGLHTIVLVIARDLRWQDGLRRCLLLLGGVLVVLAAACAALAAQGALQEAVFATFGFNRAYFTIGRSNIGGDFVNWYMLKKQVLAVLLLPLLMALTATIQAVLWWVRPLFRPKPVEDQLKALPPVCPRAMFLFGTWYAVSCYGAVLSPHNFSHYVAPTIPPLMLMAAYLINVLRAERRILHRFQQQAWVIVAFVAMGYFAADACVLNFEHVATVWYHRIELGEQSDWEIVGEEVARVTEPGDTIQCWSYMPGVYLVARRPNVCRFTTTEKMGQVPGYADFIRDELYETLMAHPPVLFVVRASDYEWLHGFAPGATEQSPIDPLGVWIDRNYERIADIASVNVYLYKRKDRL